MAEINLDIIGARYDTTTRTISLVMRYAIPPAPPELSDLWFPEAPEFEVEVRLPANFLTARGKLTNPTATYLRDGQLWRIEHINGSWNMPGVPVEEQSE